MSNIDRFLHCSDTWRVLSAAGQELANRPEQDTTRAAIEEMEERLLRPLEEEFKTAVTITYGFAGPELVKAVEKRAKEGGWLPNIHPPSDQHAGHERNSRGNRICKHDGIAADLRIEGVSSEIVARFAMDALPYDAIYLYGPDRPFHLSCAPEPRGTVIRMLPKKDGGLYPRMLRRGR